MLTYADVCYTYAGASTLLERHLAREVADVKKEFCAKVILFYQKSLKKSLDQARQHTSAYVSIRQHSIRIRQHSIRHLLVSRVSRSRSKVSRQEAHAQQRLRLPQNAPAYVCVCYPYADVCYAYVSAIRMQELIRSIGHASPKTRLHMYAYANVCYTYAR